MKAVKNFEMVKRKREKMLESEDWRKNVFREVWQISKGGTVCSNEGRIHVGV